MTTARKTTETLTIEPERHRVRDSLMVAGAMMTGPLSIWFMPAAIGNFIYDEKRPSTKIEVATHKTDNDSERDGKLLPIKDPTAPFVPHAPGHYPGYGPGGGGGGGGGTGGLFPSVDSPAFPVGVLGGAVVIGLLVWYLKKK